MLMLPALLSQFATSNGCVPPQFFGLKPWYEYLKTNSDCTIREFNVLGGAAGSDFVLIALALIDDLIRIAALVTIGYIIWGGIKYMTSQGDPSGTGQAQSTVLDALVGLIICIVAIAFVTFLGNRLGG
jgi:Type IV secretion system pilin